MVFAPAPQLTITVEERGGEPDIHLHAGGQGVWQARMITSLNVPVVLCTSLGGETGRVLEPLLVHEGVELRVISGGSCNGAYLHDRRGGSRVDIAQAHGQPLSRHELDGLYGLALSEGLRADVSLLGGPVFPDLVPAAVYRRLARDLGRNGKPVVADLSGDHLAAVLEGGVRFLKVSNEELIKDGRAADDSDRSMLGALAALHEAGAEHIVVTRAERTALAHLEDAVYEVVMPPLEAADPRGAGDSMTAGLAAVLARGGDPQTAVRTGAAAGALNVTRHGLGTGHAGAISQLMERIQLVRVKEKATRQTTPNELAERTKPR